MISIGPNLWKNLLVGSLVLPSAACLGIWLGCLTAQNVHAAPASGSHGTITKTLFCSGTCGVHACSEVITASGLIIHAELTGGIGCCQGDIRADGNKLYVALTAPPNTPIGARFSCSRVVKIAY
jgi:hypothetical protein